MINSIHSFISIHFEIKYNLFIFNNIILILIYEMKWSYRTTPYNNGYKKKYINNIYIYILILGYII